MSRMPREPGENDTQLTLKVPKGWLDEATRLADALSKPGLRLMRADALRLALRAGLDTLAAQSSAPEKPEGRRRR